MGDFQAITDALCVWQSFAQIPSSLEKWRSSLLPTSGSHIPTMRRPARSEMLYRIKEDLQRIGKDWDLPNNQYAPLLAHEQRSQLGCCRPDRRAFFR